MFAKAEVCQSRGVWVDNDVGLPRVLLPFIILHQINVASQPVNSTIQIDNSKIKIGDGLNIEKPKGMLALFILFDKGSTLHWFTFTNKIHFNHT